MLKKSLIVETNAKANENQIKIIDNIRITYLTSRLIRVEVGTFTDLASFTVLNRNFPYDKFKVQKSGNKILVETSDVIFTIKGTSPLCVKMKNSGEVQYFNSQKNLKGTRRTLDATFGRVPLDDGLITKDGAFLLDDSSSILFDNEGHFVKRDGGKDYYCFAYGNDYRKTLKAFFKISGATPLVPRFALGVWWSRYHAYSDNEYIELMDRFEKEEIPLTVATIDMDWHWTDLKKEFGIKANGWTGYSWNTELFKDYKSFLKNLQNRNLKVTLNLHPAEGIRYFEDMYDEVAKAVGIDPKTKEDVKFSCKNDDFWNAYFDKVHKPYEKDGVDFWWIDWQQGKKSDIEGLDPLLALNHYHFLDNAENGELPLILSRYAGLGSHRYPLGFSGDTAINYKVLNFQPYFTANAANAAYFWWSHDIGGHHFGYKDDELYLRWIEFGVFAPILRLHSTSNDLLGKEPWKYRRDVYLSAKKWLNFRHRLIPYIFTMDYRSHKNGTPLCEPMYYAYPNEESAFNVPNEYFFGSELIAIPITSKTSKKTNMSSANAWIPKGTYTDIFTLQKYHGPMNVTLNRELYDIPVLAKEGAIIPLSNDKGNASSNPKALELWVFNGKGSFTLYEDNGKTDFEKHNVKTKIINEFDEKNGKLKLTVKAPFGDGEVIPKERKYKITFKEIESASINSNKEYKLYNKSAPLSIEVDFSSDDTEIELTNIKLIKKPDYKERVINSMSRWQERTTEKTAYYKPFKNAQTKEELIKALKSSKLTKDVKNLLFEQLITD